MAITDAGTATMAHCTPPGVPISVHTLSLIHILTAKGANKGGMVRRLAQRLGISMDHVYCAGDEANDISMLTAGAMGFAPANCIQAVRDCGATIVLSLIHI